MVSPSSRLGAETMHTHFLKESFKYLVNNTQNTYFGQWHEDYVSKYWESLVDKKVNWVSSDKKDGLIIQMMN